MRDRQDKRRTAYNTALVTSLVSGVMSVVGVVAFMLLLRRRLMERIVAAAALAEQAERLRTTLASIGDAVITTDIQGRITGLNAVAESLTGWKTEEAAGLPLETVFRIVNEQTRRPVENPAARTLREGIIVGLANHTVLIAKDGTERPIDDSAAPIRCKKGEIVGCVLVFRDVTQRRQHDNDLRKNQEIFQLAHGIGMIGHWVWDAGADENKWSPEIEALYGLNPGTFEGTYQAWAKLIHPDDLSKAEEEVKQALKTGNYFTEFRVIWPDGTIHWLEARAKVFKDAQDKPTSFMGVNMDITERKQMEEALKDAGRRKDEFLATLAHELRNPLAPLRNALSILNVAPDNQEAKDLMHRQVGLMVRLIDDLLDVNRISRGTLELRKERVELATVLHQAVETFGLTADCSSREITFDLPPRPIHLNADPVRLVQVFGNLINNACKFTEPGGKITLTARLQGKDVLVSVKDTGIGIAPDKIDGIFEMFSQVDPSFEGSRGGLGIGLALAKRLVQLHGGNINAHSEGSGKGCEFVICLPVFEGPAPPESTKSVEAATPSHQRRILVVDDNRDSADSLAMLLRLTGHETLAAYDGEEAVRAAESFRPDTILLDIGLPKLNGYDVCRRIRDQSWGKRIIIIALTGWGQADDRRRSVEAGFNGHLVKPVHHADLMKVLADLQARPA